MQSGLDRRRALIIIVAVAAGIFLVPFVLGYSVITSDNFNQNLPLRELSAAITLHGHLPLWNSLIWSGTPLLAGFNAGVLSPLSWLFLVAHPDLAFEITLVLTFSIAGAGVLYLAEALGASTTAGFFGGIIFILSGQFASQAVHIDQIEGIAFVIWTAFCGLKVVQAEGHTATIRWAIGMGISYALVITAGAPEAMLDGLLMIVPFLLINLIDADYRARKLGWLVAGAVIALSLSTLQWLPGLVFEALSNRGTTGPTYFEAGPWSLHFSSLFLMPFSQGNYAILKVPNYIGSYNLPEISTFLPAFVIFGAFATAFSRRFSSLKGYGRAALIVVAVFSFALSLGAQIGPLEALMAHVPLYNRQRLPSRNMFVVDLGLCLLFAGSFDKLRAQTQRGMRQIGLTTYIAPMIASAYALTYTALLAFAPSVIYQYFQDNVQPSGTSHTALLVITSIEASFVIATAVVFLRWTRARTRKTTVLLGALVVLQLLDYSSQTIIFQINGYGPFADGATFAHSLSAVPPNGRVAYYDPRLKYYEQFQSLGLPDLNILSRTASINGYSSLSVSNYTTLTETKPQTSFNPYQINGYDHYDLNVDDVISGWYYFMTRAPKTQQSSTPALPSFPPPPLDQGHLPQPATSHRPGSVTSSIYLGGLFHSATVSLALPASVPLDCLTGVTAIGPLGSVQLPTRTLQRSTRTVTFESTGPAPLTDELSFTSCGLLPRVNGSPDVPIGFTSPYGVYNVNGVLSRIITPQNWRWNPAPYGLDRFSALHQVTTLLKVRPGVTVRSVVSHLNGTLEATISTARATRVLRSEAFTPGWVALYRSHGQIHTVQATSHDALQSYELPAGRYRYTFAYQPSHLRLALVIDLAGLAATILGLIFAPRLSGLPELYRRRSRARRFRIR